MSEIKAVFSANEKAEQVLLAAQWLFDSYSRKDLILSYVQAMIVVEILLGDKAISDELGLGQLLRNRCAYLIASGHADRVAILEDLEQIYKVRSQIVHRGKAHLTANEHALFGKLRIFCNRIIQREVDLLRADSERA